MTASPSQTKIKAAAERPSELVTSWTFDTKETDSAHSYGSLKWNFSPPHKISILPGTSTSATRILDLYEDRLFSNILF